MRVMWCLLLTMVGAMAGGCEQVRSPASPTSGMSAGAIQDVPVVASLTPASHSHAVPLRGSLSGTVDFKQLDPSFADVTIVANGTASHLGRFSLKMPHQVNLVTASGEGTMTFTGANGDQLTATFTGHADTSAPVFVITEHATVTGGTGRFAGASGSFDLQRLYDTAANTTTGTFDGEVLLR